jgi:glycosyltransferase involved in cell wall biosynthesis
LRQRRGADHVVALGRRLRRPFRATIVGIRRLADLVLLRLVAARRTREIALRRAALTAVLDETPAAPPAPRSVALFRFTPTSGADLSRRALGAKADVLAFLADTSEPLRSDWLDHLVGAIDQPSGPAAAVPALVQPRRPLPRATPEDLLVREIGLSVAVSADGTPHLTSLHAGASVGGHENRLVDAGSASCFVVDRLAYEAAGGLRPAASPDAAFVDLSLRLAGLGRTVVAVPCALVVDHRPVRSHRELRSRFDVDVAGWRDVIDHHGPALARLARNRSNADLDKPTFAISVAAFRRVAPRWGDWHLANALARSLRRLGHDVTVVPGDDTDRVEARTADIHVVIRGLRPVRRTPGQMHVLWVISHPESEEPSECDEADLVLVASPRFADVLRDQTRTPVEVMLQATDHHRFTRQPPDPRHLHPLGVVAKTRDQFRPAVALALEEGLRPAIYGSGWESLVDPSLIMADHVPNEGLPRIYSSLGLLLNDHWDSMRRWGFVSNRIFDALACGTPVVSDEVPGLDTLLESTVPTYRTGPELRRCVEAVFAEPDATRRRTERGRRLVVEHHTFDVRAVELLQAIDRLVSGEAKR